MRIISGEYRGRKLLTPENQDIRPTSDKVREAVFNILMNDIYGAVCLDLFAGTGGLGIEALSRGADRCYFGDSSREAIRIVRANLRTCGAEDRAEVVPGDYRKVLGRLKGPLDIVFLDPPYRAGLYASCLELIDSLDLLAPDGIIVAERETRVTLPDEAAGFMKVKTRRYGKTSIDLYRRPSASDEKEEAEA